MVSYALVIIVTTEFLKIRYQQSILISCGRLKTEDLRQYSQCYRLVGILLHDRHNFDRYVQSGPFLSHRIVAITITSLPFDNGRLYLTYPTYATSM